MGMQEPEQRRVKSRLCRTDAESIAAAAAAQQAAEEQPDREGQAILEEYRRRWLKASWRSELIYCERSSSGHILDRIVQISVLVSNTYDIAWRALKQTVPCEMCQIQ